MTSVHVSMSSGRPIDSFTMYGDSRWTNSFCIWYSQYFRISMFFIEPVSLLFAGQEPDAFLDGVFRVLHVFRLPHDEDIIPGRFGGGYLPLVLTSFVFCLHADGFVIII